MVKPVLVVEDEDNQRVLYAEELTAQNCQVLEARSGRQDVAVASAPHPDVILLDIDMPDMDGLEVLRRLLAQPPQHHVILNTASALYQDSPVSWGADAYVMKRGDLTALIAQIKKAVEQPPAPVALALAVA